MASQDIPPSVSAAPSSAPSQHQTSSSASSNLYLVTFLATLFLLLFVSCAIVFRSYILRRRYQRRLDEAMAAGMLLAPRSQGSKRKRLGAKPKMFQTWIAEGGDKWGTMMPLSAQPVFVKRKLKEGAKPAPGDETIPEPTSNPQEDQDIPQSNTALTRFWFPSANSGPPTTSWFRPSGLNPRPWRRLNTPQGDDTATTVTAQPPDLCTLPLKEQPAATTIKVRVEMLQLSVLIAMPTPSRSERKNAALAREKKALLNAGIEEEDEDEDEEDPPLADLVFGITRVNYRHSKVTPTPTLPSTPIPTPSPMQQSRDAL